MSMATRDPYSIRLSTEEKETFGATAESYGMSLGEYARYSMRVAPPMSTAVPESSAALRGDLNSLTNQVQTYTKAFDALASSDPNVAQALDQARAALGPREE